MVILDIALLCFSIYVPNFGSFSLWKKILVPLLDPYLCPILTLKSKFHKVHPRGTKKG